MSRRISEVESKLHQAALSATRHEITSKQAETVIPDQKARQNALNFLLGVGLFKSLKDSKGNLIFRAVTKGELEQTKDLNGEESLVLGHIKATSNEGAGIWTKHLKTKTNLHQTIIDRCLKTLTQKKLIKRVPSVQHPTRKIYMLEHLEPSVGLTGGPWYTESELDTVFIETISKACLKFIRDVSFPKQRREAQEGALFPISNAPRYPTAAQVHNTLRQARLTETELSVEHVEMLLDVLVLDGEVEKLPAFGASLWDSNAVGDGDSDEDGQSRPKKKKKRRRSPSSNEDTPVKAKRKEKRAETDSDDEDDSKSTSRKKSKLKRKKGDGSDSDSDSDVPKKKKKKKKKIDSEDESNDDDTSSKKRKKRKKKNESESDEENDQGGGSQKRTKKKKNQSEEESDESDGASRKKKKKKKIKRESSESESDDDRGRRTKSLKRSPSPFQAFSFDGLDGAGGVVYRAVNQEKITLGWAEAPCSKCPSFEFCKEGGPVNAKECVYYDDWLVAGTVAFDDEA